MKEGEDVIWLWVGNDAGDREFETKLYNEVLMPAMLKEREHVIRAAEEDAQDRRAMGLPAAPVNNKPRIVLTLDGEHKSLMAAMAAFELPAVSNKYLIKLAASCSKIQQSCDAGYVFLTVKSIVKSWAEVVPVALEPTWLWRVKHALQDMDSGSLEVYLKFFMKLPAYLSTALTTRNVQAGFVDTGVYPLDVARILGQCTSFGELAHHDGEAARKAVYKLAPLVAENGQLTDAEILSAIGAPLNFVYGINADGEKLEAPKTGKELHEMAVNRRRVVVANHPDIRVVRAPPTAAVEPSPAPPTAPAAPSSEVSAFQYGVLPSRSSPLPSSSGPLASARRRSSLPHLK